MAFDNDVFASIELFLLFLVPAPGVHYAVACRSVFCHIERRSRDFAASPSFYGVDGGAD